MKSIRKQTLNGKHVVVLVATEDEIEMLIEAMDHDVDSWTTEQGHLRAALVRARYGDEPDAT
jgi:hypothetical protein